MLMWPEKCNVNLWTLAINYAVWIFNRLPKASLGGLSPDEMWSAVSAPIMLTFDVLMYLGVQSTSWTLGFKRVIRYQNGTAVLVWECLLASLPITPH